MRGASTGFNYVTEGDLLTPLDDTEGMHLILNDRIGITGTVETTKLP